jgi:hypothetical protein
LSFNEFIFNETSAQSKEQKPGTCRPNWSDCTARDVLLRITLDDSD